MLDQLPPILIPFLISIFQVITGAMTLGMIPALWCIAARKHYKMLVRWSIFFLLVGTAAVYGLPKAMIEWREWVTEPRFRKAGMYFAYFVGVFLIFFILPEPKRIATNKLKHWRSSRHGDAGEKPVRVRRVKRRRSRSSHSTE